MTQKSVGPAALSLLALGFSIILLGGAVAGWYPITANIWAVGLFLGGLGSLLAGIFEFCRPNYYGAIVLSFYGLFWITLSIANIF